MRRLSGCHTTARAPSTRAQVSGRGALRHSRPLPLAAGALALRLTRLVGARLAIEAVAMFVLGIGAELAIVRAVVVGRVHLGHDSCRLLRLHDAETPREGQREIHV